MSVEDIKNKIREIQNIVVRLRQNQDNVWIDVNQTMSGIVTLMLEFIEYIKVNGREEEIPMPVILQQIQNLNEAYNSKDYVMLADVLEHEISNALYVYIEEKEKQNGVSGK